MSSNRKKRSTTAEVLPDEVTTTLATQPHSSTAITNVIENESSLRLKRAADTFVINARAKESIASTQLAQFFEILCVRLRQRLAEIELKSRENQSVAVVEKDAITTGLSSLLSASSVGSQTGLMALVMMLVSQGWMLQQQIGFKAAIGFLVAANIKRRLEQSIMNRRRAIYRAVVDQFQLGSGSPIGKSTGEDGLQIERGVREVARVLSMRHVEQIVPLTRNSQMVLAEVMVSRVMTHLERGRFGYPDESRSPLVSSLQRFKWSTESTFHSILTPPDRIPEKKTLSLLQRCIRALTAEARPSDDVPLELEPWFSSASGNEGAKGWRPVWTANGVLSKTGLRVRISNDDVSQELFFAHEFSGVETYGYCYGSLQEAKERRMKQIPKPSSQEQQQSSSPTSSSRNENHADFSFEEAEKVFATKGDAVSKRSKL